MNDSTSFRAFRVHENAPSAESGQPRYEGRIEERRAGDLPEGDLLIRVTHSSLNYKDALSATGNKGVTRAYPHTPGIDAAGLVERSTSDAFPPGRSVIVTGFDLGANTDGGFSELIRVPAEWAVPLPETMSTREAMSFGTAGLTAAMSAFEVVSNGVLSADGEVLVTGATGGVGCVAVALMAKLGYNVVAATGKRDAATWLENTGAEEVIGREEVAGASDGPLAHGRWAAVIDAVGGPVLADALRAVKPRGVVTCCGNAASSTLETTVFPFILRGVRLIGIDSAQCPREMRKDLWQRLAGPWQVRMRELVREVGLEELETEIERMLEGRMRGRVVVRL